MMGQASLPASNIGAADVQWLLASLCQLHHIPLDAELLCRQCPPPHDMAQLLKAMDGLGLRAQVARLGGGSFKRLSLPFIAF
jgi:subfamily B ATP-binding cassette protein HlyB/CyaB